MGNEKGEFLTLNSDEIDEIAEGNDLSIEEFLADIASRGIVPMGRSSRWKRFRRALGAPFRLLSAFVAWVTWRLWGRRQYELAIRKGLERWCRNAGIMAKRPHSPLDAGVIRRESDRVRSSYDLASAQALHDEVIRTRIIPPPRPEADDTGLRPSPMLRCTGLETDGMHRGSPCQYCGSRLITNEGTPVDFPPY